MKIYKGQAIAKHADVKFWRMAEFMKGVRSGFTKKQIKLMRELIKEEFTEINKALDECEKNIK